MKWNSTGKITNWRRNGFSSSNRYVGWCRSNERPTLSTYVLLSISDGSGINWKEMHFFFFEWRKRKKKRRRRRRWWDDILSGRDIKTCKPINHVYIIPSRRHHHDDRSRAFLWCSISTRAAATAFWIIYINRMYNIPYLMVHTQTSQPWPTIPRFAFSSQCLYNSIHLRTPIYSSPSSIPQACACPSRTNVINIS